MQFRDQRVFIIGASSRIGSAIAQAFAREGASVLICGDNYNRLNSLAMDLRAQFLTEVHSFRLDVRDDVALNHIFSDLPGEWRKPDIIVNTIELTSAAPYDNVQNLQNWLIERRNGVIELNRFLTGMMQGEAVSTVVSVGFINLPKRNRDIAEFIWKHTCKYDLNSQLTKLIKNSSIRLAAVNPCDFRSNFLQASGLTPEDIASTVIFCVTRPVNMTIKEVQICPTHLNEVSTEQAL